MTFSRAILAAGTGLAMICASLPAVAQQAHTVFFALGSAALDAEARTTIDQAAAEHASTGTTSVSIVGHTDTTGSAEYNMRLSQRRAEAVAAALEQRGVPSGQITTAWRGENDLAVQTGNNVPERRNRRAEIAMGGAAAAPAPAPMTSSPIGLTVGIGPYFSANMEDPHDSFGFGGNLWVSYDVTRSIALSAEQAVYYNTDTLDDGWAARSVVGVDWTFAEFSGARPYLGANVGYTWIDGSSTGGFTYGPEIGVNYGSWGAKLAYDFLEDRDAEEGIISLSIGYLFGF